MRLGPRATQNTLFYLAAAACPLAIFAWFFHWQIIIPTNARWLLQGDWGANVIGWNALRHDQWRWPLGQTQLLAWPTGVPITFTDSNPFVSILLKPFSALLPKPFQFTGLWLLSCVLLQFYSGFLLLRHATDDRILRLIGATLLTLLPTLMNRMGHANLCAHWTILLSLHVFLNVERRRDLWFGALLVVSTLIHPYFLLMNASIWGTDVLRRGAPLVWDRSWTQLPKLGGQSVCVGLAPVLALWMTGSLGDFESEAGGYGYYSMALDAIFNPGTSGYSRFLPIAPQGEGQIFEGFQYLGAGMLALLIAAAASLMLSPVRRRLRSLGWLAWLLPALLLLTLLALSNDIQLHGRAIAENDYDWIPFGLTSTFRASGRLFWPCAYVLALVTFELIFALPRLWAYVCCISALCLQVMDLTGFALAMRTLTAEAAITPRWERTHSKKWEALIASAEVVEFQPPDPHRDGKLFYEIAWRASSLNRPVNIMYTARQNPKQTAILSNSRSRFLRGEVDPRRLIIVADRCAPASLDPARLKLVNQVMVIPPTSGRYPFELRSAPIREVFPLNRDVTLGSDEQQFRCMLGQHWSRAEGWGVWSDGEQPDLIFPISPVPPQDLTLSIVAAPYPEEQGVTVYVSGRPVGRWSMRGEPARYDVRIPKSLVQGALLHVVLKVDRPLAPSSVSTSADSRKLGIGLRSVRLAPAS